METLLFTLILVSLCGGHASVIPAVCQNKRCPEIIKVQKHEGYEERTYNTTEWLTTKIDGTSDFDLMAAHLKLKAVQDKPGYVEAWPVLINVQNGNSLSLSWFVSPGSKPQITDFVKKETRPAATYYVSVFKGKPSIKRGLEEKEKFCKLLTTPPNQLMTPKQCDEASYSGAGYESLFSVTHHNEIWIEKMTS